MTRTKLEWFIETDKSMRAIEVNLLLPPSSYTYEMDEEESNVRFLIPKKTLRRFIDELKTWLEEGVGKEE